MCGPNNGPVFLGVWAVKCFLVLVNFFLCRFGCAFSFLMVQVGRGVSKNFLGGVGFLMPFDLIDAFISIKWDLDRKTPRPMQIF